MYLIYLLFTLSWAMLMRIIMNYDWTGVPYDIIKLWNGNLEINMQTESVLGCFMSLIFHAFTSYSVFFFILLLLFIIIFVVAKKDSTAIMLSVWVRMYKREYNFYSFVIHKAALLIFFFAVGSWRNMQLIELCLFFYMLKSTFCV